MKKLLVGILSALMLVAIGVSPVKATAEPSVSTYDFITTDNGMQGYWATDHFHSKVTITPLGDGCYQVVREDGGTFNVLDGAMSPGGVGGSLVGDGTQGTISGGITEVICGTLRETPLANDTPEDLRSGEWSSYANKYFHRYFSNITSENITDWGWTFETCNNGTWVDNDETESAYPDGEAMGDITGAYVPCEQPVVNPPQTSGFSPAGAPVCSTLAAAMIQHATAKRINPTSSVVSYWPTITGGEVNIRYREAGAKDWQHALRNYPNFGVAPIGFLKENMNYEYQLTNGYGCAQSNWSPVFKSL